MKAPPEKVFPFVSDFRNWQAWSPWVAKDPSMEVTISDRSTGMGAAYEWSGNSDVGVGRMEMVTELPPKSVRLNLTIFEPFSASNVVGFTFEPRGEYTKVTWHMTGQMSFMSKLFNLINPMDAMVGPDFKLGLEKMRALVEN